ncbi:hypothetical protein CHLRE_03g151351v5 [Chlamydomonas reinhardtii]|uniref:Uncharacterized protein n=1 Tax=Chlamydomonas reinhardtii TaxID=3055 RepID=A0A2K3DVR3_CHLRE|nr:uncharacterized protein CHLRE_03g151351v5 [Chlamydomonas reinhardtii]PNW84614.1 hypothetical protein CHLRE_03g151351v5 [Chlamydomonas reinhardtii]
MVEEAAADVCADLIERPMAPTGPAGYDTALLRAEYSNTAAISSIAAPYVLLLLDGHGINTCNSELTASGSSNLNTTNTAAAATSSSSSSTGKSLLQWPVSRL